MASFTGTPGGGPCDLQGLAPQERVVDRGQQQGLFGVADVVGVELVAASA